MLFQESFTIKTNERQGFIDISGLVNKIVEKSRIHTGLCHVFVPHATAAIIINENYDPNICIDLKNALNKAFPDHAGYLHDKIDNNAGAHIKSAVLSASESVPVIDNKLGLGTWQSLMLVELDGPRTRKVIVTIIGD